MELSAERWSYQKLDGVVNNKGLYAQRWLINITDSRRRWKAEKWKKKSYQSLYNWLFSEVWADDCAENLLVVQLFFIILYIFKEVKYIVYNDNSTHPPTINQ